MFRQKSLLEGIRQMPACKMQPAQAWMQQETPCANLRAPLVPPRSQMGAAMMTLLVMTRYARRPAQHASAQPARLPMSLVSSANGQVGFLKVMHDLPMI